MGEGTPKMTGLSDFAISAGWRNRRPTTQEIAHRFDALVEALAPIHPAFRKGWVWIKDDGIPYEAIRADLVRAIEAGKATDDNGTPWPDGGYRFSVLSAFDDISPPSLEMSLEDGWLAPYFWANVLAISTPFNVVPEPSLCSYDVICAAMLAGCEIFEADSCIAYTDALTDLDEPGACKIGWMTYIGPEPAPLITPPPDVIVEHRPNGGLFMAVTRENFDVSNPAHVAAAREILAAVRPFNEWAVKMGYR